jgi:hypothetical protein
MNVAREIEYYAVLGSGRTVQNPSGLARRRMSAEGQIDEALQRDMTWVPSSAIIEWEYGDVGAELIEISEADAEALVERFREKWGAEA